MAEQTDVAIIGAGPAGLFAVFECGMLKMSCHVIDVLDAVGGQCRALYPQKPIYDIPGYPKILAGDLVANLEIQAGAFDPVYHLGRQVVSLSERDGGWWRLETAAGDAINAKAVIIAAGVGAFAPKRPPLDRIMDFESQGRGLGVHYLIGDREDFRDKKVVIAGGGDSAVDWAISLSGLAKSVSVVHRREKFRAAPGSAEKLRALAAAGRIEIVTPYQLAGLDGETGLKAVIVQDMDGDTRRLEADALLPFYGLSQNLGPIAEWELDLEKSHISVDPATGATSRPGIFAVGDIATYPGKLKLILSGFAEAAQAAHAAFSIVRPSEALHFEYSTTQGLPEKD
ncbi:MAG TPA: NAD(P)/FAD-dependent oxidoreductase [Alphaproteobacteria bacterium]|nr:NAD(P)/FAD-dependent oxidoreductase [Alphaproteobacteria bacterium]